jgi:hypothetical protein
MRRNNNKIALLTSLTGDTIHEIVRLTNEIEDANLITAITVIMTVLRIITLRNPVLYIRNRTINHRSIP